MDSLATLVERFDPDVFDVGERRARLRLEGAGEPVDAVLEGGGARLEGANGHEPDARLTADEETWAAIAEDASAGLEAFRAGRLRVRRDLHLGVGFLAATAARGSEGLRFRRVDTEVGAISTMEAGSGDPVILVHGLGATKASFLPTLAALAPSHRAIAIDLPGFGDSDKPFNAPYHAPYFARSVVALLDALELERAHIGGNSMGGRVAIELGLRAPERVDRLALLSPSLAWLRDRPWAPLLRLVDPRLGAIQPAPRKVVESIVRRVVPGGDGWTAAGVDEFLRAYLTRRGRAAFYAAARNIYLDEPYGEDGFWTRLKALQRESLFMWGRKDTLVPIGFMKHVEKALPNARHVELECGHVPQVERPRETHAAIRKFLAQL
jgi:pimeloyl-ACP methyl ester carboxylesterase